MAEQPIHIEVLMLDTSIRLIVPKQEALNYESAAPRLRAFAESLGITYGLPVELDGDTERHLRDAEHEAIHARLGQHAH